MEGHAYAAELSRIALELRIVSFGAIEIGEHDAAVRGGKGFGPAHLPLCIALDQLHNYEPQAVEQHAYAVPDPQVSLRDLSLCG